jgi:fumarate reductase subunit D
VVIDSCFLLLWALVTDIFHHFMAWVGPLPWLPARMISVAGFMLEASTLTLVVAYIVLDCWRGIQRISRAG